MKAFVNLHDGSNVTEISPILTCIHTLNESFLWDEDWSKYGKGLSLKQLRSDVHVSKEDGFCFAVSLRDGSCLYTSDYITNHLGYPKDMLNGQCIMNFLFHKDHITFANHLMQGLNACFIQEQRDDSHLVLNTFFCRLRMYHSLKFGYSVSDRKTQYKPFKIILHINELIVDDVCVERPSGTLCVKASATHVSPAYSTPGEIPAMTSFSTRHTASCHFSHVDASAIPYLGYLPQDMIGYSVFDFYHIDDMLQLKDIYELVVKEHGSSFQSKPYRFKVQNGCYILLETEWSCFINPWSHKLEFVVGQHRVLKGPLDIDIFSPCQIVESSLSHEITKEGQNIQKEIKALLSQSIQTFEAKTAKRFCNKRKRDLAAFVCNYIGESLKENKTKCNGEKQVEAMDDRSNSDPDSVVMGDISPYREINYSSVSSETPPTVQQLRCQENIERFFASLPNTYSNGLQEYDKNDNLSSDDHSQASSSSGSGNGSGKTSAFECQEPSLQSMSPETNENNNQKYGSSSSKCDTSSFTAGDSGYGKSLGTNVLYSGSMPYFPPAPNAQPQWLFGPAVPPMSTPKPVAKPESSTGSFQFPSCSNDSATNCLRTAFPKFSVNENLNLQSSGLTTALTTTNTVAAQSEMDFEKEKCCANTRSHKIELTTEIAYRYQMNVPSMADVLKKDRDFLNSLKQPELVNQQLQLLQGEREAEIKSKLKVEENEFCMTEEIMLGLATEDDVNEELEYREECLLQLISEDSL